MRVYLAGTSRIGGAYLKNEFNFRKIYKWLFNKENSLYLEKTSGFILSFIEININFAANFKPYCTSSV